MLAYLCEQYPDIPKEVVFADTGWEHPGTEEWCRQLVRRFGLELRVVRNSRKNLLTMAEARGKFPGMQQRQCTSDLKRDPIASWIRRFMLDRTIVNCLGMRAEESSGRAKMRPLKRNKRETNSKRTVWDWLPIHGWSEAKVLAYLEERGLPLHPVYSYLRRFSCRLCIFMTLDDVRQVQKHDPEAIQTIRTLEEKIGFSFFPTGYLRDLLKLPA